MDTSLNRDLALLGGGCFWCLDAAFRDLRGVIEVESGYAGGHVANPTYRQVCAGTTGHAEVVQITFDPSRISYRQLLEVFFTLHDPTTPNRQGNDVGPQYRSVIFHRNQEQRQIALDVIKELQAARIWPSPIVTELKPFTRFWPAEPYHQEYYRRNTEQAYCQVVISPKLAKLREHHAELLKSS